MIRAEIGDNFAFGSDLVAIRFPARDPDALRPSQFARVTAPDDRGAVLEYVARDQAQLAGLLGPGPTISLTEPEARALLEALAAHFGGTGPAKAARDDLLHERGRVDKLTDALIGIATAPAPFMPLAETQTRP